MVTGYSNQKVNTQDDYIKRVKLISEKYLIGEINN
jgi:hypothetical protein